MTHSFVFLTEGPCDTGRTVYRLLGGVGLLASEPHELNLQGSFTCVFSIWQTSQEKGTAVSI